MRWNELDVYPALGGTYGNECILGHAESFFGGLRDGLVLTLLDVPALDARSGARLERRVLGAGRPRSGAARRAELLRPDGRDPDRDVALRPGAAERASTRSTSRTASTRRSSHRGRRPRRGERVGLPASAFVVGAVAMNKGYPSRKSLPQIVEAFAAFRARHAEAMLYLHTDLSGAYQEGVDLAPAAARVRARPGDRPLPRSVPLPVRSLRRRAPGGRLLLARRAARTPRWARASGCRCSRRRPAACRRSSPTSPR